MGEMATAKEVARTRRKRSGGLDNSPQLAPIKEVAAKFGVTAAGIRKWVDEREFPRPHIVIGRTWFYRADQIDHKLRTGRWPAGVHFHGDPIR